MDVLREEHVQKGRGIAFAAVRTHYIQCRAYNRSITTPGNTIVILFLPAHWLTLSEGWRNLQAVEARKTGFRMIRSVCLIADI